SRGPSPAKATKRPFCTAFLMGGYWARPSDPQLGEPRRAFAPVSLLLGRSCESVTSAQGALAPAASENSSVGPKRPKGCGHLPVARFVSGRSAALHLPCRSSDEFRSVRWS